MNAAAMSARSATSATTDPVVPSVPSREIAPNSDSDLISLQLRLELQSMSGLLTVLPTIARLGGNPSYILAADSAAEMHLLVPQRTAHRFAMVLDELVEVIQVTEIAIR